MLLRTLLTAGILALPGLATPRHNHSQTSRLKDRRACSRLTTGSVQLLPFRREPVDPAKANSSVRGILQLNGDSRFAMPTRRNCVRAGGSMRRTA